MSELTEAVARIKEIQKVLTDLEREREALGYENARLASALVDVLAVLERQGIETQPPSEHLFTTTPHGSGDFCVFCGTDVQDAEGPCPARAQSDDVTA